MSRLPLTAVNYEQEQAERSSLRAYVALIPALRRVLCIRRFIVSGGKSVLLVALSVRGIASRPYAVRARGDMGAFSTFLVADTSHKERFQAALLGLFQPYWYSWFVLCSRETSFCPSSQLIAP